MVTKVQLRQDAPCHNCRRQRLKCDRSLPHCLKCTKRGQECMGYQRLIRWEQGLASRGKMAGLTFAPPNGTQLSLPRSPKDPLMQDLSPLTMSYMCYFANSVCKHLVLYDIPGQNPFRELIPQTHQHPILLQTIVGISALHMSNAYQTGSPKSFDSTGSSSPASESSLLSLDSSSSCPQAQAYKDALVAKEKALRLLKSAVQNLRSIDIDIILAVMVLFIEFELVDSGRDNWTSHVGGIQTALQTLCAQWTQPTHMTALRKCLISNYMVFDAIGSTLANSKCTSYTPETMLSTSTLSLLQDAEGNHCSSFPTTLLRILQTGAHLYRSSTDHLPEFVSQHDQIVHLLNTAHAFDPYAWAKDLQSRSPASDLTERTNIASAHRSAVCIYLSRILRSCGTEAEVPPSLEGLVSDVISHLSAITPTSPLFTATTWPAFIAGAETNDVLNQMWARRWFEDLWEVEPWGLIKETSGVLERIWERRSTEEEVVSGMDEARKAQGDWLRDLRQGGIDWLII